MTENDSVIHMVEPVANLRASKTTKHLDFSLLNSAIVTYYNKIKNIINKKIIIYFILISNFFFERP